MTAALPEGSPLRRWRFGPFVLLPHERKLLEGNREVALGSRAMELLVALVSHAGSPLSRQALMRIVWPDTVVIEANLNVHISALRKALRDGVGGQRYIVNLPGRGYQFVHAVDEEAEPSRALLRADPEPVHTAGFLPRQPAALIGRDGATEDVMRLLRRMPQVSIVGPGGIGKTVLSFQVAQQWVHETRQRVLLVELAELTDASQVCSAVLATLGVRGAMDGESEVSVVRALADQDLLLLLDNCEHVALGVAALLQALLRDLPRLKVLCTTREALRIDGEGVHRLKPLSVPRADAEPLADELLRFDAIRLFLERAQVAWPGLAAQDCAALTNIARRLDGVPLAIEFAAARAGALGIQGLAAALDDRLSILTAGRRTALPRHQTMHAALAWSYGLLDADARQVFRASGTFAGSFALPAIQQLATPLAGDTVLRCLSELVDCSLAEIVPTGSEALRFRLLEPTRAFALSQLDASGNHAEAMERHAKYFLSQLQAHHGSGMQADIANVRSALSWVFSVADMSLARALAVAAAPLLVEHCMLLECCEWCKRALNGSGDHAPEPQVEMQLQLQQSLARLHTRGVDHAVHAGLQRAAELARQLGAEAAQHRALVTQARVWSRLEQFVPSHQLALECAHLASRLQRPAAMLVSDCLLSTSHFFMGEFDRQLLAAERVLAQAPSLLLEQEGDLHGIDPLAYAGVAKATALWMTGRYGAAIYANAELQAPARPPLTPVWTCFVLTWSAIPMAMARRDFPLAQQLAEQLHRSAVRHGLGVYQGCASGLQAHLAWLRGRRAEALRLSGLALHTLRAAGSELFYTPFLTSRALLLSPRRRDEALAVIDEVIGRCERSQGRWWWPVALLTKARLLSGVPGQEDRAAQCLAACIAMARATGARSVVLRATAMQARLLGRGGQIDQARQLLAPVLSEMEDEPAIPWLATARRMGQRLDTS